jgi:hypothetical protein
LSHRMSFGVVHRKPGPVNGSGPGKIYPVTMRYKRHDWD